MTCLSNPPWYTSKTLFNWVTGLGGAGNVFRKVLELNLMDACPSKFNLINCELFKWSTVIEYYHDGTTDSNRIMLWALHTNFNLWHASNVENSRHIPTNALYLFWAKILQNIILKSRQVRENYHIRTCISSIHHKKDLNPCVTGLLSIHLTWSRIHGCGVFEVESCVKSTHKITYGGRTGR